MKIHGRNAFVTKVQRNAVQKLRILPAAAEQREALAALVDQNVFARAASAAVLSARGAGTHPHQRQIPVDEQAAGKRTGQRAKPLHRKFKGYRDVCKTQFAITIKRRAVQNVQSRAAVDRKAEFPAETDRPELLRRYGDKPAGFQPRQHRTKPVHPFRKAYRGDLRSETAAETRDETWVFVDLRCRKNDLFRFGRIENLRRRFKAQANAGHVARDMQRQRRRTIPRVFIGNTPAAQRAEL